MASCRPQLSLRLQARVGWGGARRGAGRPSGARKRVSHLARPELSAQHPVHVTLRVAAAISNLRARSRFLAVRDALRAGREREGFRLVHFSVQSNHLHLLVEAKDREALSRGTQGLKVRLARAINKHDKRTGAVFSDRFHARALKTPRETRHALAYVLLNARKHANDQRRTNEVDPCSSGMLFNGWSKAVRSALPTPSDLVSTATTWLLRVGWRTHGPISPEETPRSIVATPLSGLRSAASTRR